MHIVSNKTIVRVICFTLAALLALAGGIVAAHTRAEGYHRELERSRLRALQEAAGSLHSISVDLEKTAYAGTPAQLTALSAQVWRNAATAKQSLAALPMDQTGLETTYRYLSQVGEYALYLSAKAVGGEEITGEEWASLYRLVDYARTLSEGLSGIEQLAASGEVEQAMLWSPPPEPAAPGVDSLSGFAGVEQAMAGYPKLIYDGPFSDNLLEKTPALTRNMDEVPRVDCQRTAARFAGVEPLALKPGPEEDSRMPSYTFTGDGLEVGVTKQGGLVTYLSDSRPVGQRTLTVYEARQRARDYLLEQLEIPPMKECYYEITGGICTVNFAAVEGDITLYPDQIKVGVAMDDGSVVFYDARSYINNHCERALAAPGLTRAEAQAVLGGSLEVRSSATALIPTASGGEALTYEFRCLGLDNQEVLVYVNALTGREEQILMVLHTENGVLTV